MPTIKELKEVYLSKGYTLSPYSEKQIAAAVKKHKTLPATLLEYYSEIGAINNEASFNIHILAPEQLHITSDGEESPRNLLIFAEEMQGVITLGVLKKDLKNDNPLLYGSGDAFEEYLEEDEDYTFLPGDMYAASSNDSDTSFLSVLDLLWSIAATQLGVNNPLKQDTLDPKIIAKKEKVAAKKKKEQLTDLAHSIICGEADASLITDEMIGVVTKLEFRVVPKVDLLARFVKLKSLEVRKMVSSNISWISNLKDLSTLVLCHFDIEDITPLSNLSKLNLVLMLGNKIKDVSALAAAKNLKKLYLADNDISDTSSFRHISDKLIELDISYNKITTIDSLEKFVNLDILDLRCTDIENIDALAKLKNLRVLYLNETQITDLSALKNLEKLESLSIKQTKIKSLKPLQNYKQRMWSLDIKGTAIEDIDCIKDVQIRNLEK